MDIFGLFKTELSKRDQTIAQLKARNQELESENQRLRELLNRQGESKASKTPTFKENYSLEKNQSKRKRRRKSTGRYPQEQKLKQVEHRADIYPANVDPRECDAMRLQCAWRMIDGKATYVCYTLYATSASAPLPSVPGLRNRRSEYGIEIILMVAFLHYWVGISLGNVCQVLRFFTGLDLSRSQANVLLNQLSNDWSNEYDTIAELLAHQLVLYIDETGWKVGKTSCYTWVFSTAMHVLFRCGVGRGKAEAQTIVGEMFNGIGVSDDYGAYKHLFEQHQLCWAHLLRKAIKLTLQHPEQVEYKEFLDQLYQIYQQAIRFQKDRRLSVGRAAKVAQLQASIVALCSRAKEPIDETQMSRHQATFIRLQNELVKGLSALFVFVEHPEVEPTNNRSERNLRREAEIRKGGRTNKSQSGAKRRSIIMTVLGSLNTRVSKFTLEHLLSEVERWTEAGCSLFESELENLVQAHGPPASSTA